MAQQNNSNFTTIGNLRIRGVAAKTIKDKNCTRSVLQIHNLKIHQASHKINKPITQKQLTQ